jgi:hypothetical protein
MHQMHPGHTFYVCVTKKNGERKEKQNMSQINATLLGRRFFSRAEQGKDDIENGTINNNKDNIENGTIFNNQYCSEFESWVFFIVLFVPYLFVFIFLPKQICVANYHRYKILICFFVQPETLAGQCGNYEQFFYHLQ